ncbi:hypothetical protein HGRIS_014165 [Hohenbuehelia grisea]|uniref:N-acetyltransferase domain-containing protein n=1 Tax=Hohenbuehelia grisea TaxID=104357 RepID=A0ABR3JSS0_9AGAR
MTALNLQYDWVSAQELQDAIKIEEQGFPPDEAASYEAFCYRQAQAPDLFLGAYLPKSSNERELIGYICSTLAPTTSYTHESISTHVPGASSVCLHSICVRPDHQRQGVALALLNEYATRLETARREHSAPYDRILLIAHEELCGLYEKAGFEKLGPSPVVHGSRPWFDLRRLLQNTSDLPPSEIAPPAQQLPPGIWEALQRSSTSRNRPVPKSLNSFAGGLPDVLQADPSRPGLSSNKFDLLCPHPECGSIILKSGVGKWVERASVQMEPADHPVSTLLSTLPPPPETTQWWLVTPTPMAFENIGFTRPAKSLPLSDNGKALKLLACAECDLGPLGWSEEGGSEFWLACARVGYRAT